MIIEILANSGVGAHEIAAAISNHSLYEASVVFRSKRNAEGDSICQYTVKIEDTKDIPVRY